MGFDKRQIDRDGFEVIVSKEDDHHSAPDEFDCYDEEDKEAWRQNEWRFVTVVARAFLDGTELGFATLGGCEEGCSAGWKTEDNPSGHLDAYSHTLGGEGCYDVPGDAIEDAKKNLARLLNAAKDIDLKEYQ